MRRHPSKQNMVWTVLFSLLATLALNACSDSNNVSAPPEPVPPGPLAIATNTLPSGSLGIFYDVTLSPSGGAPPYSWSHSSGSLPNGLNLDSSGRISGTPRTIQTVSPTFRLLDSTVPTAAAVTKQLPMSITAVPQPTIITPSPLPNGIVGLPYPSTTLTAVGGTPPYTWSEIVAPLLPAGLTFNAATATISGIPSATETNVTHTFSVTDSFSPTPQTVSKGLRLTVSSAPLPLNIVTPDPLPPGTVTVAYPTTMLVASGGTPPYTWSTVGNLAPAPGLSLSSSGVITGTPSSVGSPFTRTYQVQDSGVPQQSALASLSITISLPAPPNITTTSALLLPNGTFNVFYMRTLQVSGGTPPFVWSFTGGSPFPNWLNLDTSSGVISGTPNATGTFNFNVQVTDSLNQSDPTPPALSITIDSQAPPTIDTPSPLPNGTVGTSYSTILAASGGTGPGTYTWTLAGDSVDALPTGLTLAVDGTLSGTPDPGTAKTYSLKFTVKDTTPQSVSKTLDLTIDP